MPLPLFSPSLLSSSSQTRQSVTSSWPAKSCKPTKRLKLKKKERISKMVWMHFSKIVLRSDLNYKTDGRVGEFQFVHESHSRFLKTSESLKCKSEVLSGYSVVMWVWHFPWVEKEILYAAQWAAGEWYKPRVDAANTVKDNSFLEMNKTGNSASDAPQACYHRKVCSRKPLVGLKSDGVPEGKSKELYIY